jgi:hypothetical protein
MKIFAWQRRSLLFHYLVGQMGLRAAYPSMPVVTLEDVGVGNQNNTKPFLTAFGNVILRAGWKRTGPRGKGSLSPSRHPTIAEIWKHGFVTSS